MDTFYALEQAARNRIMEFHQEKAQQNLSVLLSAQSDPNNQVSRQGLFPALIPGGLTAKSKLAIGMMLAVSFWFGFQAWINQAAIHASNALSFNSERYFIAAVIMGFICWRVGVRFTKRAVLAGCLTGVAFALMMTCESQSLMLGSAERMAFLGSLFVIPMPFLGRLFRGQKLYRAAIVGSIIVIVGMWCLFGTRNGNSGGDFFALLRAGATAGMLLTIQHFAGEDWRVSSFINLIVVATFSIAVAGLTGQIQVSLQPMILFPAALSAVLGSVAGGSVLIWSGRYLSSALSGVLMFLEAPLTLLWGVILVGTVLTPASVVAYMLIGMGTICVLAAGSLQVPRVKPWFTYQTEDPIREDAHLVRAVLE